MSPSRAEERLCIPTFSQKDIDAPDLSKIGCFTSITCGGGAEGIELLQSRQCCELDAKMVINKRARVQSKTMFD